MSETNSFERVRRSRSTRTGNIAVDGDGHGAGTALRAASANGRDETPLERVDRNMQELNGELRVVVTGVQVLFAFLLVVPFDTGFRGIGGFERAVYLVTLIFAALAAVCTIAPSAQHRFLFRYDDKPRLVYISNRVVIAGLACLAVAMCGSLLLVATKLFGVAAGAVTTIAVAAAFGVLWFAMPLRRRRALGKARVRES
jgi:O-antigen/teichoic acid export membrane protein